MLNIFGGERNISIATLIIGLLLGIFLFLMVGCTTNSQSRPVQIEIPHSKCPTCISVEITKCYFNTAGAVLLLHIDDENGDKEILPASNSDKGCRCVTMVGGVSMLTINTIPDHVCKEWTNLQRVKNLVK